MGRFRARALGAASGIAWAAAGVTLAGAGVVAVAGLLLVEAGCELFERSYQAEHGQRPGRVNFKGPRR